MGTAEYLWIRIATPILQVKEWAAGGWGARLKPRAYAQNTEHSTLPLPTPLGTKPSRPRLEREVLSPSREMKCT